jgi:hypothetical protein
MEPPIFFFPGPSKLFTGGAPTIIRATLLSSAVLGCYSEVHARAHTHTHKHTGEGRAAQVVPHDLWKHTQTHTLSLSLSLYKYMKTL